MTAAANPESMPSWRPRLRRVVWNAADVAVRPTASVRTLPDYLILGAQRAGTTSLQQVLAGHPDIASPRLKKGVHYFDAWYHRGPQWYRSQFQLNVLAERHRRLTGHQRITGEASPYYLFHPDIPRRISELLPRVKMIALLRDPIERAVSHHKHEARRGYETEDLPTAVELEAERLAGEVEKLLADPSATSFAHRHHSYVARGQYAEQVRRYLDLFGRDQLLVVEAESFWESPSDTLPEILDFLGLAAWSPKEFPRANATRASAIDPGVRAEIAQRVSDSNTGLQPLLGRSFRWA